MTGVQTCALPIWTYNLSEDELTDYVTRDAIAFNRVMMDYLAKYRFTIYDTSSDRERVFDKIIEDIMIANKS